MALADLGGQGRGRRLGGQRGASDREGSGPVRVDVFHHLSERANKPITWYLRDDHRGRLQTLIEAPGGVLYRNCFPRTAEQIQRWNGGKRKWSTDLSRLCPEYCI
jgi:hypothetical protein